MSGATQDTERRPLFTLLLPGLDGTARLFARFAAAASGRLALHLHSYPADSVLSYAELAEQVRAELPRDRPFVILAESFSGPVALRVAKCAPPGLVAVALVASFHRRPVGGLFSACAPAVSMALAWPIPAFAIRLLLAGREAPDELVAEVQSAAATVSSRVLAARIRAALQEDGSKAVATCPVPLLFLAGTRDRLLRSEIGSEVRKLNPRVEIRMLDTPHMLLQVQPQQAMALLEEFFLRAAENAIG